jgi:hypothetical protein
MRPCYYYSLLKGRHIMNFIHRLGRQAAMLALAASALAGCAQTQSQAFRAAPKWAGEAGEALRFYIQDPSAGEAKTAWQFRVDDIDPKGSCLVRAGQAFYPLTIEMQFDFEGGYTTRSTPTYHLAWLVECDRPITGAAAPMASSLLGEGSWVEYEGRPLRWASLRASGEAAVKLSYRSRSADGAVGPWMPIALSFARPPQE